MRKKIQFPQNIYIYITFTLIILKKNMIITQYVIIVVDPHISEIQPVDTILDPLKGVGHVRSNHYVIIMIADVWKCNANCCPLIEITVLS